MKKLHLLSVARAWPLLAVFALLGWSPAHATFIFEILRIDGQTAQISGTGVLHGPLPANSNYRLSFDGATSTGDRGFDSFFGTLTLGGIAPDAVYTRKLTNDFWFTFGTNPALGSPISGLMTATLDVEQWAPVGTTGTISGANNTLGSYTIVSSFSTVPIPAAVWLFGSGLLGLAGIARRRKVA